MDKIFVLGALSAGSLYLLNRSRKGRLGSARAEGFESVTNAFGQDYKNLVQAGIQKHNDVSIMTDPLKPPGIRLTGSGGESSAIVQAQKQIQQATTSVAIEPSGAIGVNITNEKRLLNSITPEGRAKNVLKCEAVKTIQTCDAFDDPAFAQTCGVCFGGGQNSKSEPHLGGLYVDEDTIDQAKYTGRKMMDRFVEYNPTVGKCDPGMFVVNKKQCQRLMKKLKCQKQQNFDIPGCAQCLENETFHYIDEAVNKVEPTMVVAGKGSLRVYVNGKAVEGIEAGSELSESAQSYPLGDIQEGDRVSLGVTGGNSVYLAGYIHGVTASGEFTMDLNRLILVDVITGSRPRVGGQIKVKGEPYIAMKPGKGREEMNCEFVLPFTFLDPTEKESASCPSGPFVTNANSAQYMNSGPCFIKGAAPGNYNNECVMQLYMGAGCTEKGTGYPSTDKKARELLVDEFGNTLGLSGIAERLYELAIRAFTGRDSSGKKLALSDWDYASTFCTGISRKTPCDVDNASSGPLPAECIQYLYENRGISSHIGATYDKPSITSRFATDEVRPQGCTVEGTISPYDKDGKVREDALAQATKVGGVKGVKAFYNNIHKRANDNSLKDANRHDAIQQCYGIALKQRESSVKVSRTMDILGGKPVYVYGDYNMAPWNVSTNYPDKGAKWIGGRPGGYASAPGTGFVNTRSGVAPGVSFVYTYNNTSGKDIPVVIFLAIDNNGIVFMNDVQVYNGGGGWGSDWPNKKIEYVFKSGKTDMVILQTNSGGPEGLLVSAIRKDNGAVLFHSDSSWKMLPEYKNVMDDARVRHAPEGAIGLEDNSIMTFQDNLCANVASDGLRVISAACNGSDNQTWSYDGTGRIQSKFGSGSKCLRAGTATNNPEGIGAGKAAVIGTCDDSDENKWSYDVSKKRFESRKYPGQCLDINGGVRKNASLMVYPCHDGENQRWTAGPTNANSAGGRVLVGPWMNLENAPSVAKPFGDMPRDYTFQFTINIRGIVQGWGALFRFTATKNNCCNYGDRVLCGWLYPGSSQLHIRIGDRKDGNWGCDSPSSLPLNRDVNVKVVTRGASVKLYLDDVLVNQGMMPSGENGRYTGSVQYGLPETPGSVTHMRPRASIRAMTIQ